MAEKTTQTTPNAQTTPVNPFQIPGMPAMPNFTTMPGFAEMTELWVKGMGDQQGRVAAMMDEMAKGEDKAHAEAKKAVEEMARLSMASLDYARELSGQMRKNMTDAMKRAQEQAAAAAPRAKA